MPRKSDERPGAKSSYFTITIHYKPEDGDGLLVNSMEVTQTQYSVRSAEQRCWDISQRGFVMGEEDHITWIPNHRVMSVRLDRKEPDARSNA